MKLTPAQERELLAALRPHPAPYSPGRKATADRLCTAGLLRSTAADPQAQYVLSAEGVDHAARLSAQRVIDSVNEVAAKRAAQGHAGGIPKNWPFPVSGHDW